MPTWFLVCLCVITLLGVIGWFIVGMYRIISWENLEIARLNKGSDTEEHDDIYIQGFQCDQSTEFDHDDDDTEQ